jgi:ABC-type sugar transport system substrate-binding protein
MALNNQFIKKMSDALTAEGQRIGVTVVTADANNDVQTQTSQIQNFIAQKVDAIILNATDATGMGASVDAIKAAGIPLIEVNAITDNSNYVSYVGSDSVQSGVLEGNYLLQASGGTGNVVILDGVMGQEAQIDRKNGLAQTLLAAPGVKLLAEQTGNWDTAQGMSIMQDWLSRFPQVNIVAAQNDAMALGALQAIKGAGRSDVLICGIDALPDALTAVQNGEMACTVFQDAVGQGTAAIDVAADVAQGKTVPPQVMIPYQLVTKDNLSQFVGK